MMGFNNLFVWFDDFLYWMLVEVPYEVAVDDMLFMHEITWLLMQLKALIIPIYACYHILSLFLSFFVLIYVMI